MTQAEIDLADAFLLNEILAEERAEAGGINGEGLTFPEWLAASGGTHGPDTLSAWFKGEDPTEYRK